MWNVLLHYLDKFPFGHSVGNKLGVMQATEYKRREVVLALASALLYCMEEL